MRRLSRRGARTLAVSDPFRLHATYETYAAGMHVAEVETGFSFGPWAYQINLDYHTTGMVGFYFSGHQFDQSTAPGKGMHAEPSRFVGEGGGAAWTSGGDRVYRSASQSFGGWCPPNDGEREPVPDRCRPTPSIRLARSPS